MQLAKKKEKQEDGSDSDSDESDEKRKQAQNVEKVRLFSEAEVLDIEEAQEVNAFEELKDKLEDNFLAIETENFAKFKNTKRDQSEDEDGNPLHDDPRHKPFNFMGVNTLVNLHDHVTQLQRDRERDGAHGQGKRRGVRRHQKKRKNHSMY